MYSTTGRKAWHPHFCLTGTCVLVNLVISLPRDYCNNKILLYLKYYFFFMSLDTLYRLSLDFAEF